MFDGSGLKIDLNHRTELQVTNAFHKEELSDNDRKIPVCVSNRLRLVAMEQFSRSCIGKEVVAAGHIDDIVGNLRFKRTGWSYIHRPGGLPGFDV